MPAVNQEQYIDAVLKILGLVEDDVEIVAEVRPLSVQAQAKGLPPELAAAAILAHFGAKAELVEGVVAKALNK